MFYDGYAYHRTTFEQTYRCYPSSFIDKPQIESGDKIIMPPSALDRLASLHIDYPMLFELRNTSTDSVSHCGVLEFIAEEGVIYMPYWMMQNLLLQEGDIVRVRNVTLPKGTYVKLQPHTTDFLDIANPKAILETALRNYSCLTVGDSIMVPYNNKKYFIDILEAKPSNGISIIETDCEVDFAPPLDYKEPERPVVPASAKAKEVPVAEAEPKFNPFTGSGRRLDGRPLSYEPQPIAANSNGQSHSLASSSGSEKAKQQTQGKLVFGSNVDRSTKETTKVGAGKERKQEEEAEKKDKFNAFSDQTSDIHWFTLCRKPNGQQFSGTASDHRLVHIPSLPPMPIQGSYVGIGSNIFVMGGFCNWKITSSVSLIDCRTHTAQTLPDMPKAVAISVTELIDRKIYVIGGSDTLSPLKSPSRSMMVYDTDTEMWELRARPDWEAGKRWFSSVVIGGKIYMRTYYNSFVYDPNEDSCDRDEVLHSKEWSSSCVIDDVLYYYDVRGNCLRAYDPKQRSWGVVKGFEGLLPEACKWSKTVSCTGGNLVLFLQKTEETEIWSAEIAVERREGGEIWGKVEWCSVVLDGNFHIMDCVAVEL
ncbi:unnamed protein product [Arabidopsis arenosa]|uniref:Uncharacterized protein n=1 Tax=Arabidopsis arenosa TaxID=38785 RepID=A0A8S2AVE1_ARAAE|nr:unnamed protein product [Arabidopsis arenosa]